ncbi:MBL fold metallo-hydrolase [Ornithinibacillus sp. L9]|uniref:MBL fold metallo-hydrolase n=1 Tax=Ornithinibacillus caprae TaxID=2678566 RepID=A0A6N8FH34_9BACI|nr:ribonuclease Z [Ornithinibacillus caprae]MUK87377.1 MBL fold metallo-hydrolase [Ornithinibacillus caprae]
MYIHFLGTGSAYPGETRDNTSLNISNNGYHVLVDVSGNPCKKLKQLKIGLDEVDAVIFTHFHIDHIYGLPSLLWGMWLEHRKESLTIYVDSRNEEKLNEWLQTMNVKEWGIEFPIHIVTFQGDKTGQILKEKDLEISCFPAIHSVPTIGLEIRSKDKIIVYSGDSEINAHIQSYNGIDVLIHEATSARTSARYHSSLEGISKAYNMERIGEVVAVHLSDNEPYEEVLATLPRGKFTVAEDLMTIKI